MANAEFYIAFTGPAVRFPLLSRFFDRLVSVKGQMLQVLEDYSALNGLIRDSAWIDLLDSEAFEKVTGSDLWGLESILECVLISEYGLVRVNFHGQSGRLDYDPWAYPFGGTDSLIALVRMFGFDVTRDSFWDGFAEFQGNAAGA